MIWLVQLIRLVVRVTWFLIRHPLLDPAGIVILTWIKARWPGLIALAVLAIGGPAVLRLWRPDWFTRFVGCPARCRWRWWFYRRHWRAVLTIAGLAPPYRTRAKRS